MTLIRNLEQDFGTFFYLVSVRRLIRRHIRRILSARKKGPAPTRGPVEGHRR